MSQSQCSNKKFVNMVKKCFHDHIFNPQASNPASFFMSESNYLQPIKKNLKLSAGANHLRLID